jgi:predicted MFS family arabinose efflux permease
MRFLLSFAQGGLLSPLLPLLRETFHVSYAELGLLTAMPGVSSVIMDIIATYLLNKRPLLQLLQQGITLTVIALLCSALAPGFYWLIATQMLLAFGLSLTRTASLTVMVTATPREAMGRANNLLEFSAIAGLTISPTLSGLTAAWLHWRLAFAGAVVFVIAAYAWVVYTRQALATAMDIAANKPLHPASESPSPAPTPRSSLPMGVCIAYITTFVLSFTWSAFLSNALPLFGGEVVGLPTSTLGIVFTTGLLCDLILLMPMGWLSDRLEYRVVLAPAMLLMALTLLCLPAATTFGTLILVSIGLHTGFAAWGMPSAALALYSRGEGLARAMGIYRLLVDGAVVIAPWLVGTLIGLYGYGVPAYGTAMILLANALLVAWGLRQGR